LQASPGISPDGARRDHEVINTFDFLDSQTFTTLAMAESADYRNAIDWRRPIRHAAERFSQTANKNGELFEGFNISKAVAAMEARNAGIAWEFTGQMVVALRLVDREFLAPDLAAMADHYVDEIRHAQAGAPFGDGRGLVAATIDGPTPRPVDQCLDTPFQCIPERVGLAASAWAVFADADVNPLSPSL
jgi:hypothetical protein